jgi:hypothetical protein
MEGIEEEGSSDSIAKKIASLRVRFQDCQGDVEELERNQSSRAATAGHGGDVPATNSASDSKAPKSNSGGANCEAEPTDGILYISLLELDVPDAPEHMPIQLELRAKGEGSWEEVWSSSCIEKQFPGADGNIVCICFCLDPCVKLPVLIKQPQSLFYPVHLSTHVAFWSETWMLGHVLLL